jgi:uncharacterized FlgJ-related protein
MGKIIFYIVTLMAFGFMMFSLGTVVENSKTNNTKPDTVFIDRFVDTCSYNLDTLKVEELKRAINDYNISYANVVFNQAVLETGNFTSNIFLENNNMFGMTQPGVRKTTSLGEKNGFANYSNWLESLKDYKYYQEMILSNDNVYLTILKHQNYAEDNDYINKITRLKNT